MEVSGLMSIRIRTLAFPFLLLAFGCESDDPIQPNLPNASASVLTQHILGSDERASVVYNVAADASGQVYFEGVLDDGATFGIANPGGIVDFYAAPMTGVREIRLFAVTFGLASEVAMVVGYMRDGDLVDAAIAGIDATGAAVVERRLHSDGYDTWINDIVVVSTTPAESRFVAAGGARKDDVIYPLTVDLTLASDGRLLEETVRIIADDPGSSLWWITWNENAGAEMYFASVGHYDATTELLDGEVYGLDDTLGVVWRQPLAPRNTEWLTTYSISYADGSAYVVGTASIQKGDRYRRAGIVASVTEAGRLNWCRKVSVSDESDGYFNGAIAGGALFAAGEYSSVTQRSTKHSFGYGLISKFGLPSGEVIYHKSFGGERYSSRVLSMQIRDGTAYCGGYTRLFLEGFPWYSGWLVNVNIGEPAMSLAPAIRVIGAPVASPRPRVEQREVPR